MSYGNYGGQRGGPPAAGPPGYDSYSSGYSGYSAPRAFSHPSGPPHGADPQLWAWFAAVDTDRSGAISLAELQRALINGDWSPFDVDTVKLLMSIFDTDRSGTIGFNEFSGLWKYIKDWQNVFRHFDRDRSGSIDREELHAALKQFGFNLSPQLLTQIERKYATGVVGHGGHHHGIPSTGVSFDRFVRACVVVKQLTEAFQRLDTDRDGWIQISYDQFMMTVLAAP